MNNYDFQIPESAFDIPLPHLNKKQSSEMCAIVQMQYQHLKSMRQYLDYLEDSLFEAANYWANLYIQYLKQQAEEGSFLKYGTRVRRLRGTFQAEWFERRYFTNTLGEKQIASIYIKKGPGNKYKRSLFKKARSSADLCAILEVEKRYAVLREQAKAHTRVRLALNQLQKVLEEFDKVSYL